MKSLALFVAAALAAPVAFAIPHSHNSDLSPTVNERIVANAKEGPLMLRRYVARLQTFNVRIDFDTAVEIAQESCMNDARARNTDVFSAAKVSGSSCEGWISRTFARVES